VSARRGATQFSKTLAGVIDDVIARDPALRGHLACVQRWAAIEGE